jgi:hypothetical protein
MSLLDLSTACHYHGLAAGTRIIQRLCECGCRWQQRRQHKQAEAEAAASPTALVVSGLSLEAVRAVQAAVLQTLIPHLPPVLRNRQVSHLHVNQSPVSILLLSGAHSTLALLNVCCSQFAKVLAGTLWCGSTVGGSTQEWMQQRRGLLLHLLRQAAGRGIVLAVAHMLMCGSSR